MSNENNNTNQMIRPRKFLWSRVLLVIFVILIYSHWPLIESVFAKMLNVFENSNILQPLNERDSLIVILCFFITLVGLFKVFCNIFKD